MDTASVVTQRMTWSHRLIVLTGIVLCFGPAAIVFSCPGIFYAPVTDYLGVPTAELSFYMTIVYLTMMAAAPLMGSFLKRFDARWVSTMCGILVGVGIFMMSTYEHVWQWWISGVLIGFGQICNLWLLVPILVNRWFKKKAGFCIGLCMAFTGIGGVVFNIVGQMVLGPELAGWRDLYMVFGVVAILCSVPFTLFCIRSFPSDKGLLPYGAELSCKTNAASKGDTGDKSTTKLTGFTAKQAMRKPYFYTICLVGGLFNLVAIMAHFFPQYVVWLSTDNLGVPIVALIGLSGTLESFTMAGQASGKVVIGAIESRTIKGAILFCCLCGIVGITACWQSASFASLPILFAGGFIFGFCYASVTVLMPMFSSVIFGLKEYDKIYSRVQVVNNLMGAFAAVMWAWVADTFGYATMFSVAIVVLVIILILALYTLSAGTKGRKELEEKAETSTVAAN